MQLLWLLIVITVSKGLQVPVSSFSQGLSNLKSMRLASGDLKSNGDPSSERKGFGKVVNKPSNKLAEDSLLCPCCSSLSYRECCEQLHTFKEISNNPISVARARYSAFVLGKSDFIIDSTHFAQSDYKRYAGAFDSKKARKLWEKDIVRGNSNEFDFLKFEIITPSIIPIEASEKLSEWEHSVAVTFRIVVRKRIDSTIIFRKETSIYRQRDSEADQFLTLSRSRQQLLFAHGVLSLIDQEEADEMAKDINISTRSTE